MCIENLDWPKGIQRARDHLVSFSFFENILIDEVTMEIPVCEHYCLLNIKKFHNLDQVRITQHCSGGRLTRSIG